MKKKVIQPVIQKTIEDFASELNAYNKDKIGVEREIIADCVAPKTPIKIKINDTTETLSISKFFSKFSKSHPQLKKTEIIDLSNYNYQILSYNEERNIKELKKILNVQKKVTTKRMLDLISPTGKTITVTEDHLIAVNVDNNIIWKEAKNIDENDDVVMYDNTFYTKENCTLYGFEYINHGSQHADLSKKGKSISEAKNKNFSIRTTKAENEIVNRLDKIYKRQNDHFKNFLRVMRYNKTYTREQMINFFRKHFKFDSVFLKMLSCCYFKSDDAIKKYRLKLRHGHQFYKMVYLLDTKDKRKRKFSYFLKRCEVIQRKAERRYKTSALHRRKETYRRDVAKITKRSIKQNTILNIEKVDKYNYSLDHIVPIMYGFHNNIPADLIGHVNNLMVIPKVDNIKKRCNIDYDHVDYDLFKGYI